MTLQHGLARNRLARATMRSHTCTYHSLLCYSGWSPAAQDLVKCAASLANRFGAALHGVATPALVQEPLASGFEPDQAEIDLCVEASMALIEQRFEELTSLVAHGSSWTWRRAAPVEALAMEAHGADLLIVNPAHTWPRRAVAADGFAPLMRLGRPVLVIPWELDRLDARVVAVCWNDSPQCQRAMADAMPFLVRADRVILQHFCRPDAREAAAARLREIERSLRGRGVAATSQAVAWTGRRTGRMISDVAVDIGADLIVAGAYSRGPLARALLGSTTDDLVRSTSTALLLSR